jgi:sec-independent protein translocase protein TatA
MGLGGWEWGVILLIVLIFFGAGKLPDVFRQAGKGIRAFKDASEGKAEGEEGDEVEETPEERKERIRKRKEKQKRLSEKDDLDDEDGEKVSSSAKKKSAE